MAIFIIMLILITSSTEAFARGRSFSLGRSFSSGKSFFGSSKSSSSKSWWGGSSSSKSSSSKSSVGSFWGGSSKSSASSGASTKSSSRGIFGSFSSGKSSTSTSSLKSKYLSDSYKKQASTNNYNKYKQKLDANQQKTYSSGLNSKYSGTSRMNYDDAIRTRTSRINSFNSRPVFMNVNRSIFGGPLSYGYGSVGIWDLWFLMRASELFWFHHWAQISPYRNYFDAKQYTDMEARVKTLEAQNTKRDPNYLDPNVSPDLQYSPDYQKKHLNDMYYTNKYPDNAGNPIVAIVILGAGAVILIIVLKKFMRPRKKSFRSSIY